MPLRPRIIEWEGEFNAFNVLGRTGTGKTSTLELLYQIMGAGENPIGGDQATIFTSTIRLSASASLPVWFDEDKPSD